MLAVVWIKHDHVRENQKQIKNSVFAKNISTVEQAQDTWNNTLYNIKTLHKIQESDFFFDYFIISRAS